jgi:hypothetical protein
MSDEANRVLVQARIIWAALLTGPLVFFGIVVYLLEQGAMKAPAEDLSGIYIPLAWGAGIAMPVLGMVVRSMMSREGLRGDPVPPQKRLQGYIIVWAFCEGAALLGVTLAFINASLTPYVFPAALAWLLQAAHFPMGPWDGE